MPENATGRDRVPNNCAVRRVRRKNITDAGLYRAGNAAVIAAVGLVAMLAVTPTPSHAAGAVVQSGTVLPGHQSQWITNGVIGDGGAMCAPISGTFVCPTITYGPTGCITAIVNNPTCGGGGGGGQTLLVGGDSTTCLLVGGDSTTCLFVGGS